MYDIQNTQRDSNFQDGEREKCLKLVPAKSDKESFKSDSKMDNREVKDKIKDRNVVNCFLANMGRKSFNSIWDSN